jgi:hypothetical protein
MDTGKNHAPQALASSISPEGLKHLWGLPPFGIQMDKVRNRQISDLTF